MLISMFSLFADSYRNMRVKKTPRINDLKHPDKIFWKIFGVLFSRGIFPTLCEALQRAPMPIRYVGI